MKHRSAAVIVGILISMGAVCLLLGAYLRSDGFMQKAAGLVQEQAAELLATRVEVGAVSVDSFHSLSLRDLVIYDQQDAVLAKAKSAQVSFSLLSLLREPSAAAVSKVSLVSPEVWLSQQADNRWNYEAIIEASKQAECDLIFMASHGRRGLSALLLGSETNKVLTHSTIPVLVYR